MCILIRSNYFRVDYHVKSFLAKNIPNFLGYEETKERREMRESLFVHAKNHFMILDNNW